MYQTDIRQFMTKSTIHLKEDNVSKIEFYFILFYFIFCSKPKSCSNTFIYMEVYGNTWTQVGGFQPIP